MATHPATGEPDDSSPAEVEKVRHAYPRQIVRVGEAGYKGNVEVFDSAEEIAAKARRSGEDKARTRSSTK